jgi:cytochrome c oxidase subunit 1
VVAHFHTTLISSVFFGGFAGLYFWFPKMFGRMMNEALGKIHFWLTFIFFNAIFGPMHLVGLGGMMRRIANPTQYDFLKPIEPLNVFITLAAILLILSQITFVINFLWSLNAGKVATANPWEANTLEWSTTSPPPHDNFTITPTVYRGPYEYSSPEAAEDWLPQDRELIKSSKAAGS